MCVSGAIQSVARESQAGGPGMVRPPNWPGAQLLCRRTQTPFKIRVARLQIALFFIQVGLRHSILHRQNSSIEEIPNFQQIRSA